MPFKSRISSFRSSVGDGSGTEGAKELLRYCSSGTLFGGGLGEGVRLPNLDGIGLRGRLAEACRAGGL